jgi:hypothetical protein
MNRCFIGPQSRMTIRGLRVIATVFRLINPAVDTMANPISGFCRVLPRGLSIRYEPDTSQEEAAQ